MERSGTILNMVRLNRNQLSADKLDALFTQLNTTLGPLSATQTGHFLSDLLGKEERIMLAKRLAIIVLLVEGTSLYRIARILKVSPSTAETIRRRLVRGRYSGILGILSKNKNAYASILDTLDAILQLGGLLPRYNSNLHKFLH
jgi:hypothetical protein